MKRGFPRIRIILMAFGLGLACVYMWQGLSLGWWGVPVDLPEARSDSVLEVMVPLEEKKSSEPKYLCDEFADTNDRESCLHQVIFKGRDMSLYDDGGRQGCSLEKLGVAPLDCERSLVKARRFVWDHWKKHKLGYVIVEQAIDETERVTHLFVEPTAKGNWRVVERPMPMLRKPEDPEHYLLDDIIEIKWKRATNEDKSYGLKPGTLYLELSDAAGDSLIL